MVVVHGGVDAFRGGFLEGGGFVAGQCGGGVDGAVGGYAEDAGR